MSKKKSEGLFMKMLVFAFKNFNYLKAYKKFDEVKTILMRANMELGKLNYSNPVFQNRIEEFNYAAKNLLKGRWGTVEAMKSKSKDDWKKVFIYLNEGKRVGAELHKLLTQNETSKISIKESKIYSDGTEINFEDGIPLVPEIQPIIILKGSDYQMGIQYAKQVIEIFGKWIFEQKSGNSFSKDDLECLNKWEKELKDHAPELLDFIKGWSEGANQAGVAMSYKDVLNIWAGHKPPESNYLGMTTELGELPPPACSGAAAWGKATIDGKLVTASSGDYDPTHSVTMIVYPETGNSYIFTPFSVVGDVPFLGKVYMFGHPGLNEKGLAYVHHGGNPKMIEPKSEWGYGIRRAASIMHVLRFADNAQQAKEMELSFPVGDVGLDSGTAGGFYADSKYGYVIESRKNPILIREAGTMGEEDFLFANNSAIHPDADKAGWMSNFRDEWSWDKNAGWYPKEFEMVNKWGTVDVKVNSALKMIYNGSRQRNLYLFDSLAKGKGNIDFEFMKNLFRVSGSVPEGDWKTISKEYKKTGKWGKASTGNAMNGVLAVMKPDEGIYSLCVGEAKRGLAPTSPLFGSSNPMYAETNAFWEIKLTDAPREAVSYARKKAEEYLRAANIDELEEHNPAIKPLKDILIKAQEEYEKGKTIEEQISESEENQDLYLLSKALRAYTRAQVRALQVSQEISKINQKDSTTIATQ